MTRATLLLVDDQIEAFQALIVFLEQSGFRIVIAKDGRTALQRAEKIRPDLILLDVLMPAPDGFETCRRLKQLDALKETPIIFMTGLSETLDKVKGFDVGGVDYLTKPVQHGEVLARINTHLTNARLRRQLREEKLRFQTLTEATFEGILLHQEGMILEVNPALEAMFGYSHSEVSGKQILEFIAPEFRQFVSERLQRKSERPSEVEGLKKDGSSFPIEIQARSMPYNGAEARVVSIRDLSWRKALEKEKQELLQASMEDRYKFGNLIGKSPLLQDVYHAIAKAAESEANVVIYGESGTGKELAAQTIHQMSPRKAQDFVAVNCGAVPESLFEREFFGHRKGAFTGAAQDRSGYFDRAHKGTLFLDEVGELSSALQVKLLRVIESGEYRPVGDVRNKKADARIIAATNKDLNELRQQGKIREDFFYRISVILIHLPPLRDRREDIPLLIDYFLKQYSASEECSALPAGIVEKLCAYEWPGNVRELQNELQRYLAEQHLEFGGNSLRPGAGFQSVGGNFELMPGGLRDTLEVIEKRFITRKLQQNQGHTDKTAADLQIPLRTLQRKIHKYGIKVDATNGI